MNKKIKNFFLIFAQISIFINSFVNPVLISSVFAQEVTPEVTPEVLDTPTPEPSSEITLTPTEILIAEITPTTIIELTPTTGETLTSTVEVTPTTEITPTEVLKTPTEVLTTPSDESASPTPLVTDTPSPTPEPTVEPTSVPTLISTIVPTPTIKQSGEQATEIPISGIIETTVKENNESRKDLLNPILFTDKSDYQPTEIVIINGHGFQPNTNYRLIISGGSLKVSYDISTDFSGSFTYSYQLDGIYRPQYMVESFDNSGKLIASTAFTDPPPIGQLFFSEYIEGTSYNKAVEIYNPTSSSVDLSGFSVHKYTNGSITSTKIDLSGTLNPNEVLVICHNNAIDTIKNVCDLSTTILDFNGNDAIALQYANNIVDVIGQIGNDPGTEWGSGLISTADSTLVRKCGIIQGDTDGNNLFDPSTEWDGYVINTIAYLGSHTVSCPITDTDSDNIADTSDNCPTVANFSQEDNDGDLVGNVCDNCPTTANADQTDTDNDGIGDNCDNCVNLANSDQADDDNDGIGNSCDIYNCISTGLEICNDGIDNNCDTFIDENCSDTTAPITTSDAGSYTFGMWTNTDLSVSLTCLDDDSGCYKIYWCYDDNSHNCYPGNSGINFGEYTAPLIFSDEGTWYLRFFSQDNQGNLEEVKSRQIKIDKTQPVINFVDPTPDNGEDIDVNFADITVQTDNAYQCWIERNSLLNGKFESGSLDGWTSGGYAPWTIDCGNSTEGSCSAKSGDMEHLNNVNSWMKQSVNLSNDGNISFWWKVNSEGGWDYLRFYIDGGSREAISGGVGWQEKSYSLSAGTHELMWHYSKDGSITIGDDAGWVDNIQISDAASDIEMIKGIGGLFSGRIDDLVEGNNFYKVRCQDEATNVVRTEERNVVVDTTTPNPTPTPTSQPTSAPQSDSGQTSSSNNNNPPVCNDKKPESAPRLLNAEISGVNEVTLTWEKASDPVSYYLLAYGFESGQLLFGNPNIGNSETTKYVVKSLSGGKKYYFKIRAGNGCMPGDFSNEMSVDLRGEDKIDSGGGTGEGFEENVLGTEDSLPPATKEEILNENQIPWWKTTYWIGSGIGLLILAYFIFRKKE